MAGKTAQERGEAFLKQKCSSICWTLNNPSSEAEFGLLFPELPITYICWGEEIGESGTPHFQGYAEFSYSVRIGTMVNWPGFERMHIEPRRGTQDQAIRYTKKDGIWIEIGEKRAAHKRGQRRDLDDVRTAARDLGMKEVANWANFQQIRVAEKFLTYCEKKRNWKPTVVWLYGETGCGKSRMAHNLYPEAYTKGDSSKWWDGYDNHEDVILDDFRGDWMPLHELLTLLDRYERRVEFKGGCRQFLAKNIVITSCKRPEEVYNVPDENIQQLLRRIDIIEDLGREGSRTAPCPEVGGNTDPNLNTDIEGHTSVSGVCSLRCATPAAPESRPTDLASLEPGLGGVEIKKN